MVFSDKDKILIKNLHDSKGTGGTAPKRLMKVSFKKVEPNGTAMQHHVYQRQIYSADELKL